MVVIDVVIFSDVCLYREGLARILVSEPGLRVVGALSEEQATIDRLVTTRAHVVLIDLASPSAFTLARRLATDVPRVRLVAVGVRDDRERILECAEAGITGYVCREGAAAELIETIRGAVSGELRCTRRIAAALIERVAVLS